MGEQLHTPPTLTRFLSDHDSVCEGCGYNLRGVEQPFCPECGRVIPRPHVDDVERMERRAQRRTVCIRCKYPLASVNAETCPECGESVYFMTAPPAKRTTGPLLPIPSLLNATTVLAIILVLMGAANFFRAVAHHSRSEMTSSLLLTFMAAPPLAGIPIWMRLRPRIDALPEKAYRRLIAVCLIASLADLLVAKLLS